MQKQEIINVLRELRDSHVSWLRQGQIILDGINLDRLEEPVGYDECDFSQWYISSKNKTSAFSWLCEIQEMHENLHQSYNDLFFGSIRKYKPKTISELIKGYEDLKSVSKVFKEKLNDTESKLHKMSDASFEDLVAKSHSDYVDSTMKNSSDSTIENPEDNTVKDTDNSEAIESITENTVAETNEIEEHSNKQSDMQEIDINLYGNYQNPFDNLESIIAVKNGISIQTEVESLEIEEHEAAFVSPNIESINVVSATNVDVNIKKSISLKEQNIIQLKQEKELIALEVNHLKQTQKLTEKSVEQLDQYYASKQQEVELEQKDNGGFIDFKNNAKKQVEDELNDIQLNKSTLNSKINDLEKQNIEHQLEKDQHEKEVSITKKFEELKTNKNIDLEKLQDYKKSREDDLVKLKEQMLLLEEEIVGMNQDINNKQQDLVNLEEKETLKNEERSSQKSEQEKSELKRNDKIVEMKKNIDQLSDDEQTKQIELNTVVFQINELKNNSTTLLEANSDELANLEKQQERKRKSLLETETSKSSKQEEIKDIEILIIGLERSLKKLKIEQNQIEQDVSELATTE